MSDAAVQLIDAFSALPVGERHAVLVELARLSEGDARPITDYELSFAGSEVFAMYDREEEERGATDAG